MDIETDLEAADERSQVDRVALAQRWCAEIKAAQKAQAKWEKRARDVEKIYNDERDLNSQRQRRFNVLWSNVETLRPAIYMQTPKAKAVRRYRDKDPVARFASMLIERSVQVSCEQYDFDQAMDFAVRDRLVAGRGQSWLYIDAPVVGEGDQADVAYWQTSMGYVPWPDFLHGAARQWDEVPWVGRRFYRSRRELKKWLQERKLDPAAADRIELDVGPDKQSDQKIGEGERNKAELWEIWDKAGGEVVYIAPGSGDNAYLGAQPPVVRYKDFWPCPRPMLGTTTATSLIPTPDYALYQDQAEELNRITARIGLLQKALKVAGVYDANSPELANLLTSNDNDMIPVKDWAMFAEAGGARNRIEWFPVEQVASVLQSLYLVRDQAKQALYEVSGLGDILRGQSDPSETATAQGIKAKWGSLRIRRLQKDAQRFAADALRLKAEAICEVFPFEVILQMSGVDQELLTKYVPAGMDPRAFLGEVEGLLRNDVARNFRIDVESDSTIEPDEMEEKQARTEFVTAMTTFLQQAAPIATSSPEVAGLVGELMLFAVRGFKKAESLEATIEQAVEGLKKTAAEPKPNPQADADKAKMEFEREKMNMDLEFKREEMNMKREDMQVRQGMDRDKMMQDADLKRQDIEARAKPAANVNIDSNGVMQQAADSLQAMAMQNGEALTMALESVAQAVDKLGSSAEVMAAAAVEMGRPKRSTKRIVRGADGRAEGIEELVG